MPLSPPPSPADHPFVNSLPEWLHDKARCYLTALDTRDPTTISAAARLLPPPILYNLLWLAYPGDQLEVVLHATKNPDADPIALHSYPSVYNYDVLRLAVMQQTNDQPYDFGWLVRCGEQRVAHGRITSDDLPRAKIDLPTPLTHSEVRWATAEFYRAAKTFFAACVRQRLLTPKQRSEFEKAIEALREAYLSGPSFCSVSQPLPKRDPGDEETRALRLWTDKEDYVIAENLDDVAAIMAEQVGYASAAEYKSDHGDMKEWREFPADQTFRLRLDNGRTVEQVPCYFIQQYGKGHLASANE